MKRDPIRLRDDPDAPPSLRADLAELSARPAPLVAATAATLRLRTAIENGGKLSLVGHLAKGISVGGELFVFQSVPWILGALVLSGATIGALVLASSHAPSSPAPVRQEVTAVAAPAVSSAPPSSESPPAATEISPAQAFPETESPRTPPVRVDPAAAPNSGSRTGLPSSADAVAAEMADLAKLRQLAKVDREGALSAAEQGKRRFPSGLYDEDREAIAIGLLAELGRAPEAKRRATAFLARYPRSPFAERVRLEAGLGPPDPTGAGRD